ncbi:hypothetical protein DTO027B5_6863 [Paecilomyces variotii]|nr:hypothetical protein DTO021C3_4947 [Paecilomyces variotii]KAJ9307702.1 hypothetical protein DTO217A2_2706 [Paecilomyces variotii]KAJ9323004.1 hypothetical protein DTO027B3_5990 [Paecilomyces variotii]KAJ9331405.1 hypothetical protein DTO027B5_6863 [Paecilomyces variotii]KAJ9350340.1 hypothetical protein DTO027B9_7047 [Paecilomyces variotii]
MARQLSGSFCRDSCRLAPPTRDDHIHTHYILNLSSPHEQLSVRFLAPGVWGVRLSDGHAWWHFGSLTFWIALLVLFVECRPTNKFVAHIFAGAAGVVLLILLGAAVAYRIASMPKIHLWTRICKLAVGLRKRRERKKELTYFLLNHENDNCSVLCGGIY